MQELEALIDAIQKQLKDHPCKDNIREAFQVHDKEASGYVDKEMFFKICDSLNVPIDDSLIKEVSMSYSSGLIAEAELRSSSPKGSCMCILFWDNWGRSKMFSRTSSWVLIMVFPLLQSLAFFSNFLKWYGVRWHSEG